MKFEFTVYGYGNHFKNKIVPTLQKFKRVNIKNIITNKKYKDNFNILKKLDNRTATNSIYISTPISLHYYDLKKVLKLPTVKYVFCEKAITDNINKTNKIVELFKKNKTYLVETYMYKFHPEFIFLKNIIKKSVGKNNKCTIFCRYTIPKLDIKNHRNNSKLTGGHIYEIGCYPISIIYFIFNLKNNDFNKIKIKKIIKNNYNTLVKFNYKNITFIISWGYDLNYRNQLIFYQKNKKIISYKIFGKRINDKLNVKIHNYRSEKTMIKKFINADNFYYMFKFCFDKFIKKQNRNKFYSDIINVNKLINYFKTSI